MSSCIDYRFGLTKIWKNTSSGIVNNRWRTDLLWRLVVGVQLCVWECMSAFVFWWFLSLFTNKQGSREWEKYAKTKIIKKHGRLFQSPPAEKPVCFLNIPPGTSQMWVLYLWIAQWRHCPPHPPSNIPKKDGSSRQNLCHPLPHRITSRRQRTAVVRWAGNKPLECQRAPAHPNQMFWKAFKATLWFAYLQLIKEGWCQLKMSALNMQSYTYILGKTAYPPGSSLSSSHVAFLSACSILHTSYETSLFLLLHSFHFQHFTAYGTCYLKNAFSTL